jgi:hypothetical protein
MPNTINCKKSENWKFEKLKEKIKKLNKENYKIRES